MQLGSWRPFPTLSYFFSWLGEWHRQKSKIHLPLKSEAQGCLEFVFFNILRCVPKPNTGCKLVVHGVSFFSSFITHLSRKFHILWIWISSVSWKTGRPGNPGAKTHILAKPPAVGAKEQLSPSDSSPWPPLCCLPEIEAVVTALIFKSVLLVFIE